VQYAKFLPFS